MSDCCLGNRLGGLQDERMTSWFRGGSLRSVISLLWLVHYWGRSLVFPGKPLVSLASTQTKARVECFEGGELAW